MKNLGEKFKLFSEHFQSISVSSCEALATFAAYASYPALDCLSQNFVHCGQAIKIFKKFGNFEKFGIYEKIEFLQKNLLSTLTKPCMRFTNKVNERKS